MKLTSNRDNMADTVTSQTLFDGDKHVVIITNISDGTVSLL